jgi:hypothetical protein
MIVIDGVEYTENPVGGDGKNPYPTKDVVVEVVFRGKNSDGSHATSVDKAWRWYWYNTGKDGADIIASRVIGC